MVMVLAVGIVGVAKADYIRGSSGTKVETYMMYGTSEAVSLSTIPAGTRLLGFTVAGNNAAAFAGLYDCASLLVATTTYGIAEGSAASGQTNTVWFPMPFELQTRLVIIVNASTTAVTVYYE